LIFDWEEAGGGSAAVGPVRKRRSGAGLWEGVEAGLGNTRAKELPMRWRWMIAVERVEGWVDLFGAVKRET